MGLYQNRIVVKVGTSTLKRNRRMMKYGNFFLEICAVVPAMKGSFEESGPIWTGKKGVRKDDAELKIGGEAGA